MMIRRRQVAAGYIRMSSDKQDMSPAEQRREVIALAEREGHEIERWYVDEGISGDEHDRPEFIRMIADAERGEIDLILLWDQDRFSRFDLLDAAEYWKRLRNANVRIITVNQGELDFSDLKCILLATITQHSNHDFLRNLGKNVCRGHRQAAEQGRWVNGSPPYGYRIGPDVRLVPDPETSVIVRKLFEEATYKPVNQLARELNERDIRPARAALWSYMAVINILENEAYLGTVIHGRNPCGKYARLLSGKISPVRVQEKRSELRQSRTECIVVENAHPPIIEPELWQRVQDTLRGRRVSGRRTRKNSYPLTGLAVCGHCGCGLYGGVDRRANGERVVRYACQSRHRKSGAIQDDCRYVLNGVQLLETVTDEILRRWFSDEKIERNRDRTLQLLAERRSSQTSRLQALQSQIAALDVQLKRAEDRLLESPDAIYKTLCRKITELQEKRDSLELECSAERHIAIQDSCTIDVDECIHRMYRLKEQLLSGDATCLNTILQKVTVWTRPATKRTRATGTNRKRELFRIEVVPNASQLLGVAPQKPSNLINRTSFL